MVQDLEMLGIGDSWSHAKSWTYLDATSGSGIIIGRHNLDKLVRHAPTLSTTFLLTPEMRTEEMPG